MPAELETGSSSAAVDTINTTEGFDSGAESSAEDGSDYLSEGTDIEGTDLESGDDSYGEQDDESESLEDDTSELEYDSKKIPQEYKDLFKKDRRLREMYFSNAAYKKVFGSPSEAAELVESLETMGGLQGIQAERQEWATVDTMFAAGDPALVEQWAKDFPEGFTKIMPAALEGYYKADPEGYSHEIAKVFASTLQQANVAPALASLRQLVGDNPQAAGIVKGLESLFTGINKLAETAPKKSVDPERQKLQEERQAWEAQKAEIFRKDVATDVTQSIKSGIKSNLTPYLKSRKLDNESYAVLENNVNIELSKLLNADKVFQSQKTDVLATQDKARILKFLQARIDKYLPDAAKKVMRAFGSISGQRQAEIAQKQKQNLSRKDVGPGANPTNQRISRAPQSSEIDWSRTSRDDFWANRAVLRNGKKVSW